MNSSFGLNSFRAEFDLGLVFLGFLSWDEFYLIYLFSVLVMNLVS